MCGRGLGSSVNIGEAPESQNTIATIIRDNNTTSDIDCDYVRKQCAGASAQYYAVEA